MIQKPTSDRPIDRKRNSAGSFTVGGEGETIKAMITTTEVMYTVTERGVYSMQLADQIDPERTNIHLPQAIQQRVVGYGADSQFVARTFMTAGELFNRTYLGQQFPVDEGKIFSLELAKRLGALQTTLDTLVENEKRVLASLDKLVKGNSYNLPETPDLRTKVETFLIAADRIQETLFSIAHLFYPRPQGKLDTRKNLIAQVEKRTPGRTEFHVAIKSIVDLLHQVREHRNAGVHEDGPKALLLRDFHLLPNGDLSAPVMEIRHPLFALSETAVTHYMVQSIAELTEASEAMIAWLCSENITLKTGQMFQHQLAQVPDGETRFGSRYYYHTQIIGDWPPKTNPPDANHTAP